MYAILNVYLLIIIVGVFAMNAEAKNYQFRSDTYLSRQTGDDLKTETPFFESFTATYINNETDQRMDLNFELSTDLSQQKSVFNMRQLSGRFGFDNNRGHVTVGRGFQNVHLIKAQTIDSLGVDYSLLSRQLKVGMLMGSTTQKGSNQEEHSVTTSAFFSDFQTLDVFPWNFGLRFENQDFTNFNREQQRTAKLSARKEFQFGHNPELMTSFEKNLTNERGYRQELGFNFYPTSSFTYGVKYQKYNVPSTYGAEDPIFTIFSAGEAAESTLLLGTVYGSWFTAVEYSHCSYPLNENQITSGKKIEFTQKWHNDFWAVNIVGFHIESFGGSLIGDRVSGKYLINDKYNLDFSNEYVSYSKVTSAKNIASSTQLGLEMKWDKKKLWVAGELNSNNYYSKDLRVVAQLTIFDYWDDL